MYLISKSNNNKFLYLFKKKIQFFNFEEKKNKFEL